MPIFVSEDCAVTGMVTSTTAAYALQHSYDTSNSVTSHIAYRKNLKKKGDSTESSPSGEAYENSTHALCDETQMEHNSTTIGADAVVTTANQAYGCSSNVNSDTAYNVYEDCQEYSYVKT